MCDMRLSSSVDVASWMPTIGQSTYRQQPLPWDYFRIEPNVRTQAIIGTSLRPLVIDPRLIGGWLLPLFADLQRHMDCRSDEPNTPIAPAQPEFGAVDI